MLSFDEPALVERLERLKPRSRVSFALLCAERLLPAYVEFHDATGQGDSNALRVALNRLRGDLGTGELSARDLQQLIGECEALVPREDASWTDWSGAAQSAAAAVAYALRCRSSGQAQDAAWAARQAYDAADLAVTTRRDVDLNVSGVEDLIRADAVIQVELARQARDLGALELSETG